MSQCDAEPSVITKTVLIDTENGQIMVAKPKSGEAEAVYAAEVLTEGEGQRS